jgi:hypothetical protein
VSAKWLIFGQGSIFESQDDISKYKELDKQLNRLKSDVEFYNSQLGEQVTILQKLLKKLKDD